MRMRTVCVTFLLLLGLAACASQPPKSQAAQGVTFLVVRHAEKGSDDPKDPSLSAAGAARALALAGQFASSPLTAAYATAFKRTQQTAQPAAIANGVVVTTYDASRAPGDFVGELRHSHAHGTILVVGHSNTVPEIVSALCSCPVAPLGDGDYGDLFEVRIDHGTPPTLITRTF